MPVKGEQFGQAQPSCQPSLQPAREVSCTSSALLQGSTGPDARSRQWVLPQC